MAAGDQDYKDIANPCNWMSTKEKQLTADLATANAEIAELQADLNLLGGERVESDKIKDTEIARLKADCVALRDAVILMQDTYAMMDKHLHDYGSIESDSIIHTAVSSLAPGGRASIHIDHASAEEEPTLNES